MCQVGPRAARGIDAVQLIQVDALDLQPTQTAFQRGAEVLRSPVRLPLSGPPHEAGLGGDHQPRRVGVKRFRYESLAYLGP